MSRFSDKINEKYSEASAFYDANSEEAWGQIKGVFAHPWRWVLGILAVLVLTLGVFAVRFLRTIHAPEPVDPKSEWTDPSQPVGTDDPNDPLDAIVIDDPRLEVPEVDGSYKEGYYTFLVIGTDKGGGNTDTLMVVSYDVKNQQLNLMSLPRDTMVNVPWDIKKINSVYSRRGLEGLRTQVRKLIGFAPSHYVMVDLNAFVEIVDLIGGVEFDVPRVMKYKDPEQKLYIDLQPGLQTLSGEQAMGLVRWRKNNDNTAGYDDTGRIQTQQAFLKAVVKQCLALKNWDKISGYVEIFNRDVESDLTLGEMLWFAQQGMKLDFENFNTFSMPANYYASAWSRTTRSMQSYVLPTTSELLELVNARFNPYETAIRASNLDIMSINRDGSVSSSTGTVADSEAARAPSIPSTSAAPQTPTPNTGDTTPSAQTPDTPAAPADEPAEPPDQPAPEPSEPAPEPESEPAPEPESEPAPEPEPEPAPEPEPPANEEG